MYTVLTHGGIGDLKRALLRRRRPPGLHLPKEAGLLQDSLSGIACDEAARTVFDHQENTHGKAVHGVRRLQQELPDGCGCDGVYRQRQEGGINRVHIVVQYLCACVPGGCHPVRQVSIDTES